ncbi:restriction endonuclease subunit S [Epilithonimonas hominis]|uniref:restriction endonuclease subunit S n=1 Tax=Epilithonimonas hominis TaxID=420404 RepID=UPI0028A16124|nr:restriction endonuclease subunit S [Epilithonimonas hominis]
MSYKRLGDHIIEKVEFNDGNKYKLLQGVSNNKYFQKAKTNIIGIDLAKYRVAHHNQFVFNRATTRNGDKISIALRKGESCIVSPSYRIFEVRDENLLHPDYLQMWFTRPEFDRYARFKSHGSAHEFFDMEEMCEVELPIPSIEEQRQIVAQYQSIANKIKVNEQICEKLEATAQALYKHWFVDFEFPSEAGKPYKSSDGKMVWNEELGKNIPVGWEVGTIGNLVNTQYGFTDIANPSKGTAKFLRITDVVGNYIRWDDVPYCSIPVGDISKYALEFGDFVISRTGANVGYGKMIGKYAPLSVFASFLVRLKPKSIECISYLYCLIISKVYKDFVKTNSEGSAQPQANANILTKMNCLLASTEVYAEFNKEILPIIDFKEILDLQNQKLTQLQSLLLSRLAVGENYITL